MGKFLGGYHFGHKIYVDSNEFDIKEDGTRLYKTWRYDDTDEPLETACARKCPKCKKYPTKDDHDPCMANLPGVTYACCGHGVEEGYIQFENGIVVRGKFTEIYNKNNRK